MPAFHRPWPAQACQIAATAGLAAGLVIPTSAFGQATPVQDLPREGYEAPVHHVGPLKVTTSANVRIEYDNNVFAQNLNRTQDTLVTFRPAIKAQLEHSGLVWTSNASGSIYRYFQQTSENHEGYALNTRVAVTADRLIFGGQVGFERTFESRNDPEARRLIGTGPRLFTVATAQAYVGVEGNRIGVKAQFTADRYNFLSATDNERDFTSYQASLRARMPVSNIVSVFATGYVNWRDYRLATDNNGINRDAVSKGLLLGLEFDPGGKLRGEIAAGIVNLNPKSPLLRGYTGAEVRGSLVFSPRERTALTLDVFHGDVATVQQGANGRIDTRARLGIQQEVRHNLLLSAGVGWRQTKYRGFFQKQNNWGVDAEVEYLMNRRVSVALFASYLKRTIALSATGTAPGEFFLNGKLRSVDAFNRFRAGAEIRFKF